MNPIHPTHSPRGLERLTTLTRWSALGLSALFCACFMHLAQAADITKTKGNNGQQDLILISGEIVKGDEQVFKKIAFNTDRAIVIFDSPGGLIVPAMEIGRAIRLKAFSTAVIDSRCASACAIAWLAGQPRMMSKASSVGFHAVYFEGEDGKKAPAAVGNALVGSYLTSLGLSDRLVAYVTTAGPDEMRWLSKASAEAIGLPVSFINNEEQARANFSKALKSRWGEKPSLTAAARYYRLAADEGFAGAQNNLGDMYEEGEGVPQNPKFAVYWYTRAAERGEPTAYLSLATFLADGTTDENVLVEALKYALLAAQRLPDGKNKATAQEAIRSIRARLSKDSVSMALDLAKKWEPLHQEKYLMTDTPDPKK